MPETKEPACLLLMLRAPLAGRVKTRLARHVGHKAALALYTASVEDMVEALRTRHADLALFVEPADAVPLVDHWLTPLLTPAGAAILGQPGGDLGARLHHAFTWAFAHGYRMAAALGSDLPGLPPDAAGLHDMLRRAPDALIGPSPDGGYWTIGFHARAYAPRAFVHMPWSTPELYARTLDALSPLTPGTLPQLDDLDTKEDLLRLAATAAPGTAARTLAAARAHGIVR